MEEAYCGPVPAPEAVLSAWNPDPFASALVLALAVTHLRAGLSARRALIAGLVALLVLFISPLCALTTALFSARVVHHVLLVAVAAPLIAVAFAAALDRLAPNRLSLAWLVAIHAAILWVWHVPTLYSWGIVGVLPYWLMQMSLLGSAILMWHRILSSRDAPGVALLALLATIVQMGMLGALLTFARTPLYEPHLATTLPFGLTPLQDQQLAGLVMWVPAALPYLAVGLWRLTSMLDSSASRPSGGR